MDSNHTAPISLAFIYIVDYSDGLYKPCTQTQVCYKRTLFAMQDNPYYSGVGIAIVADGLFGLRYVTSD